MFIVPIGFRFRRSVGAQQRNVPLLQSGANIVGRGYEHFASNEATSGADMELTTWPELA